VPQATRAGLQYPAETIYVYPNHQASAAGGSVSKQGYHHPSTVTYSPAPQQQSSTHYQTAGKQQSHQQPQQEPAATPATSQPTSLVAQSSTGGWTVPLSKQKRESPLDLSVKTIRTPADSTLDDAAEDKAKYYHQANRAPAQGSPRQYNATAPSYDVYHQRNLQQQQQQQTQRASATAAGAPKVDFNPNFHLPPNPSYRQLPVQQVFNKGQAPAKGTSPYRGHIANSHAAPQAQQEKKADALPRIDFPTPGHGHKTTALYPIAAQEAQRKRPAADTAPSLIPNKIPKMVDSWRQTIDQEIEQRFSSYHQSRMQQQEQQRKPPQKQPVINGGYLSGQERVKDAYQQRTYHAMQAFGGYYPTVGHNQTYIPTAVPHHYPGYPYAGAQPQGQQPLTSQPQPLSRSNSNSSLPTMSLPKGAVGSGGADKRVLNLLRNSLEIRGAKEAQKKLEQEAHHVQQPSTDVTAPLQPKPGIIGRHNVSPFTAAGLLERNSNTPPTYKFHIPKAIDSVRFDPGDITKISGLMSQKALGDATTILQQSNGDLDGLGLAALLAARIRTKAEMKQLSPAQEVAIPKLFGEAVGSPPKLNREQRLQFPPRRRLFSRTEEEGAPAAMLPPRESKSGMRSSSETSVFDFPDTDSEGEMPVLERQSLEDMRRDRRTVATPKSGCEGGGDPATRRQSPADDFFSSTCSEFVEQLRQGNGKKRGRRKKMVEPEVLAMLKTVAKEQPLVQQVCAHVNRKFCWMRIEFSSNRSARFGLKLLRSPAD